MGCGIQARYLQHNDDCFLPGFAGRVRSSWGITVRNPFLNKLLRLLIIIQGSEREKKSDDCGWPVEIFKGEFSGEKKKSFQRYKNEGAVSQRSIALRDAPYYIYTLGLMFLN